MPADRLSQVGALMKQLKVGLRDGRQRRHWNDPRKIPCRTFVLWQDVHGLGSVVVVDECNLGGFVDFLVTDEHTVGQSRPNW